MPRMEAVSVALSSLVRVVYHLAPVPQPLTQKKIFFSYDEEQER